jgi:hypothetical protein
MSCCHKEGRDCPVNRKLDNAIVQWNYEQIRHDVQDFVHSEMERLLNDPELRYLVLRKSSERVLPFYALILIENDVPNSN